MAGVADPGQPTRPVPVDTDDRMADSGDFESVGLDLVGDRVEQERTVVDVDLDDSAPALVFGVKDPDNDRIGADPDKIEEAGYLLIPLLHRASLISWNASQVGPGKLNNELVVGRLWLLVEKRQNTFENWIGRGVVIGGHHFAT